MIFDIAVGVALQRPPLIDEFRHLKIEAGSEPEARLIACQVASVDAVMPVWDGIPEDVAHLPEEWIR